MRTLAYPLACLAGLTLGLPALGFHDATSQSGTSRTDLARLGEGTHLFRIILKSAGVQPLERLEDLRTEPEKKLLIVLGDPSMLRQPPLNHTLESFIDHGGALLLATNSPRLVRIGSLLLVIGGGVRVREGSKFAYGHYTDCPFVESTEAGLALFRDTKPKDRLHRVTTFQPGYLQMHLQTEPLSILATFPKDCYLDAGYARPTIMPFAIGGDLGKGRVLVLSDHHVLLNAVLWQFDQTDNVKFARNCVNWLTDSGKRDQALFLENGQAQTKFNIPLKTLPPPPLPPLEAVVEAVDDGLVGLEEEDHFNDLIRKALEAIPPDSLLRVVVVMLTVGLALLGLSRLSHARQRFEPGIPPLAGSLAQLIPSVPVVEQRQRALLREGNFSETAQALARQMFEAVLWSGGATSLPPVSVAGGWRQRRRLRRQVQQLWQLANTDEPARVSSQQLARIQRTVDAVRAALADGLLRFDP